MIASQEQHLLVALVLMEEEDLVQMDTREFVDKQHPEVYLSFFRYLLHLNFISFSKSYWSYKSLITEGQAGQVLLA